MCNTTHTLRFRAILSLFISPNCLKNPAKIAAARKECISTTTLMSHRCFIDTGRKHTLHLVLVEAMGDMPYVDDCGGVLGLFRLLHLPQLLPGASFQWLHRAQDATATPRISQKKKGAYFSHPTETKEWCGRATHQEVLALAGARCRGTAREHPLLVPLLISHPHLAGPSSSLPTPLRSPAGRRRSGETAREIIRATREELKEGQMERRDSVGFPYLYTELVRRGGGERRAGVGTGGDAAGRDEARSRHGDGQTKERG